MTRVATLAVVLAVASTALAGDTINGVRVRTELQQEVRFYVVVYTDDFEGGFDSRDVDLSVFGKQAFLFDVDGDDLDDLVVEFPANGTVAAVPFHRIVDNTIYGGDTPLGDGGKGIVAGNYQLEIRRGTEYHPTGGEMLWAVSADGQDGLLGGPGIDTLLEVVGAGPGGGPHVRVFSGTRFCREAGHLDVSVKARCERRRLDPVGSGRRPACRWSWRRISRTGDLGIRVSW